MTILILHAQAGHITLNIFVLVNFVCVIRSNNFYYKQKLQVLKLISQEENKDLCKILSKQRA
jgi:hypothetical protein